jgi:exodeoxyribonuclease VIII
VDFKSTDNASKDAFSKSIANYGYARQAAYYLDLAKDSGLPHTEFVFVAVEKEPPYAVGIYQLDQESIQWGRKKYTDLLSLYIKCRDENHWPGYSQEPQIISLPQWAMRNAA